MKLREWNARLHGLVVFRSLLDDGKIADMGTHDELMERSEIYREVYESQQKGGEDDA